MVKQYARRRVVGIVRRLVQGTAAEAEKVLQRTQGGGLINTAFIERLQATFRAYVFRE